MQNVNHHQPVTSTAATVPRLWWIRTRRRAAATHFARSFMCTVWRSRGSRPSTTSATSRRARSPACGGCSPAARRARDLSWACEFELA